ncbi:MAG TPA: glycosyltransferase 87 family protein [Candidatus Limnocylindrales bacterium]|nr:glycosyltransferase 87 family protein [Candidatus Limnocylindrales bacterium]
MNATRILNLAAFAAALFLMLFGLAVLSGKALVANDAHAYWAAWQGGLYSGATLVNQADAYLYSPAFAQAIWPLTLLPFWAFRLLDSLAALAAFAWMLWPLQWRLRAPLLVACSAAISMGNIQWAVLVAAVAGSQIPQLWAIPLLTKLTPGVGVLWFLGRRDWRYFGLALGTTAILAGISFVTAPGLWSDWIHILQVNAGTGGSHAFMPGLLPQVSVVVRVALAGVLVIWGGWRDRPWTVVVAVILAQPDAGIDTLILLAAALPRTIIREATREPSRRSVRGGTKIPASGIARLDRPRTR